MGKQDSKAEKQKYIKRSKLVLACLTVILLFLGYQASQLEFDYDFEKFFPQENDDLAFYHHYRSTFENDNDFVIVGIESENGIFNEDFLNRLKNLEADLKQLPHIRSVISPLDLEYLEIKPGSFKPVKKRYISLNQAAFKSDSLRIAAAKEPIREMIDLENGALIFLVKNIEMISKEKSDELANALEDVLEQHNFKAIHTMGKIIGQKAYISIMQWEFLTFMSVSILVLIIFLIIAYRSLWGVMIPMLTVLLAVVGSLGFMRLNGTPLNMMTTLLPVIMLVVGMSDVVHLVSKYLEEIRLKRTKVEALKNMVKRVGVATLLTSLTTALGFLTLIGVRMKPIQDFGIYTALGVILAFVLSILFIPSIFMMIKKPMIIEKDKLQNTWERTLGKFFLYLLRKRKLVVLAYIGITAITLFGASQIKFDYLLMQDLDEDQPLMQELRFFQKQFGGIRPFELAIIPQEGYHMTDYKVISEVAKLEQYLDETYRVNQMVSPTLPFKYLNKVLRNNGNEYYKIPKEKRFDYLKAQLEKFSKEEDWEEVLSKEKNLGRVFGRLIDPGSREMLMRNEALRTFYIEQIDTTVIDYRLTGTPVIIDESGRYVAKNIFYGLIVAFFLIAISMGILFRSIRMAFLSLIPNIFPIVLTAGYIGFAGIDLNLTTAIVFTIAFGIAVDDTIHFLSRFKQELKSGKSNLYAIRRTFISTGKAIIITSIILLGGFGSLLFSDFLSTYYIGLFVCMTLVFAVVTDLTLLPILLLRKK